MLSVSLGWLFEVHLTFCMAAFLLNVTETIIDIYTVEILGDYSCFVGLLRLQMPVIPDTMFTKSSEKIASETAQTASSSAWVRLYY